MIAFLLENKVTLASMALMFALFGGEYALQSTQQQTAVNQPTPAPTQTDSRQSSTPAPQTPVSETASTAQAPVQTPPTVTPAPPPTVRHAILPREEREDDD